MHRPTIPRPFAFVVAALVAAPFALAAPQAEAQDFQVLIPDLAPQDGAETRFGDRTARELRDIMDDATGYQSWDRRELRSIRREFDLDMEDLWDDCVTPMQLAQQLDAQIVFCGEYYAEEDDDYLTLSGTFHQVGGDAQFDVPEHTFYRRDREEAAEYICTEFRIFADAQEQVEYCSGDYQSGNYEDALESCAEALAQNPEAMGALWARARSHLELENYQEALTDFQAMLDEDPEHDRALENAGYAAMNAGLTDEAREYYARYLELDPENTSVRVNMAHDLATELDDIHGAMDLLREGIEFDEDNLELWQRYGAYAFRAATDLRRDVQAEDGDDASLPSEVEELYMEAVDAFNAVLEAGGDEVEPGDVRNTVRAYLELGQYDEAVEQAEFGLETFEDDARLWDDYATALHRSEDVEGALEAMARVEELDPDRAEVSNVSMRQGRWLLEVGRFDDALPYFEEAVETGEQDENTIANELFREGYQEGYQQAEWQYAIDVFETAREFDGEPSTMQQIQFFQGFSLFELAMNVAEPETLESAQESLPMFQEARDVMAGAADWAEEEGISLAETLEAVDTYVEIQETIIERETG